MGSALARIHRRKKEAVLSVMMMTAMIIMHPGPLMFCVYAYLMHVCIPIMMRMCRAAVDINAPSAGWCAVCMIDWRRAQNSTCPFAWHLGKKRVTTLVIFHHTPGPFVRLPAGIMTTMRTPDAAAAATGEQMALRARAGFCVGGRPRRKKSLPRPTHTQKPNGRNKSCKFDFGSWIKAH